MQLADVIEKQKELQQQREQEKILTNILAVTTEPPHVNSYVYVNFLFNIIHIFLTMYIHNTLTKNFHCILYGCLSKLTDLYEIFIL